MKIELRYFTGTGNSLKVFRTCHKVFIENKHSVNLSAIKTGEQINSSDIIGFCFPVYAFGIPRICRKYLNKLQRFENKQKAFVLVTAGDADESGFSINETTKILEKKNCSIVYTGVVQMPINWTTSPQPPFPPNKDEAKLIIEKGLNLTKSMTMEIIAGTSKFHMFNYPKRYNKLKFYSDYLLFKYLGISNLWRNFKVYESCTGCGICVKACPTASIKIVDKKPLWSSTCEQCMRCVNYCPNEAIYQTMGGDTKGKNKYLEPSFNPIE
jgi:Pyruvate/2-oxoacid:ferredoxin oxidoreductase delta subunit/NAD(P)H-dependent FMN reductase